MLFFFLLFFRHLEAKTVRNPGADIGGGPRGFSLAWPVGVCGYFKPPGQEGDVRPLPSSTFFLSYFFTVSCFNLIRNVKRVTRWTET